MPVQKSVFPDYIVCLEEGKTLKRYLRASYGLTLEQYRDRWGLPHDYPMPAPNYAERRSDLAKALGLVGRLGQARIHRCRLSSARGKVSAVAGAEPELRLLHT